MAAVEDVGACGAGKELPCMPAILARMASALDRAAARIASKSGFGGAGAPGAAEELDVGLGDPLLDLALFWRTSSASSGTGLFSRLFDGSAILQARGTLTLL